jgi:hypothetical protein
MKLLWHTLSFNLTAVVSRSIRLRDGGEMNLAIPVISADMTHTTVAA